MHAVPPLLAYDAPSIANDPFWSAYDAPPYPCDAWSCEAASLIPQRFDRIELRRLGGRVDSEHHAEDCAESKGDHDSPQRRMDGRKLHDPRETEAGQVGQGIAPDDADDSAETGQRHRLDEELDEHVMPARADGLPDADLPRPLCH